MPDQLPYSAEAERAVLGCILLEPASLAEVIETVTAGDFFAERHRLIMHTLESMAAAHQAIDIVTLSDELSRTGELEKAGGAAYIAALVDGAVAGPGVVKPYAAIVLEKSRLRRLLKISALIQTGVRAGGERAHEISESAVSELLALGDASGPAKSSTWREASESLLKMLDAKNLLRIDTGIYGLDRLTGGFLAGELVLFTAEVGAGKTLLAEQTRLHACRHGMHGLFSSAEMSKEQLASRELATAAKVERYKMRFPKNLTVDDWTSLTRESAGQCQKCEILEGEITMPRVVATASRMRAAGNLNFVVVDYDELIGAPGKDELERHAAVATACKSLAKSMAVPVILISQLRKLLSGEDRRRPTLDRLYGAGAKRKHASTIIYVWRKYLETHAKEDESEARFIVLKNRNGKAGAVRAHFDVEKLQYREVENEEPPQKPRGRPPKPAAPVLAFSR